VREAWETLAIGRPEAGSRCSALEPEAALYARSRSATASVFEPADPHAIDVAMRMGWLIALAPCAPLECVTIVLMAPSQDPEPTKMISAQLQTDRIQGAIKLNLV
jgi:hypothetical protein